MKNGTENKFRNTGTKKESQEPPRLDEYCYRALFENSHDAILLTDPSGDGRFIAANPEATRMLGWTEEELHSHPRSATFNMEDPNTSKLLEERRKHGRYSGEASFKRKDGTIFPGEISTSLFQDAEGRLLSMLSIRDISKRREAEEALRRYHLLALYARDIMLFVRLGDGRILEANEAALRSYGYSREELLSLTVHDLRGQEHRNLTEKRMARGNSSGILFETEHHRKDGTTFPVEVSSRGIRVGDEQVLLSIIRDMTERREADDRLRRARDELEQRVRERTDELTQAYRSLQQSEARYKDLYDQANDILFTTDLSGTVTTANSKAIELFYPPGVPVEEISLAQVLTPESFVRAAALIERAVAGHSDLTDEQPFEFEARDKDGNLVHLEVKARLVRENGIVTGLHAIARDVTQRQKLHEEWAKLSSAVERAGEGIFMLSLDQRYTYVNEAFCKTYGFTREEMLRSSTETTRSDRYPESFHDAIYAELQAGNIWSGHQTRKRKNGEPVEAEITIAPIYNVSGAIVHYVGVNRDITKQLQIEQQLRQKQKMEAIGTLAGGIAHDFNNMLAVILGNAELALDELHGSSDVKRSVDQIVKASKRARDLVKQILTFSRKSEHGKNALKLTPLIKETFKLLRGSLPSTIHMKLDLRAASDAVIGDPSQIQQILMNLAANAAHAMQERGGSLLVALSDAAFTRPDKMPDADMEPGRYVKLRVKDTGTGMTEEVQKRIFEPFFTTKEASHGTGMGLAVVYGIVKSHGGAISVESRAGEGSTFTVFLPCAKVPAKEEQERAGTVPGGTERILFVDDEPAVLEMTRQVLQRLGYDVVAAAGGSEALKAFTREPQRFDLIITDQTMPDLTGIEIAKKMLKMRKDMPIILITGYSETLSKERALAAGIREFLMKPLSKETLAGTVRRVLDNPGGPGIEEPGPEKAP